MIPLQKAEIKQAARVMARAFYDEPISRHAYPDLARREKKLPYVYEFLLRYAHRYGQIFVTSEKIEGLAAWIYLEKVSSSLGQLFVSGAIIPLLKMGIRASRNMRPYFGHLEKKHKIMMPGTHWYLMLMGVAPEAQRQGYATKLINNMLTRIDHEGLPCYLETDSERNISVYQRFGFKVIEEFDVPKAGVREWAMLREGRGKE